MSAASKRKTGAQAGNVLLSHNGRQLVVDDVEIEWEDDFEVCNLQVDGDPNYAVGLNSLLVHNWCKILESVVPKISGMIRPHAHHIVMKGLWSHLPWIAKYNNLSKQILKSVGIDGLYDKASARVAAAALKNGTGETLYSLVWARNWDHSAAYAQSVYLKLQSALLQAIKTGGDPKVHVRRAMEEIAEFLGQNGGKFGNPVRYP
ncbi:MAG: hypothetical protein R3C49_05640 [Planctomycetaceae bacterium]